MLEEAFAIASEAGQDDHAARALVNLAGSTVTRHRGDPRAADHIESALRFVLDRGLDGYVHDTFGVRANLRLMGGDWPAAEADARAALDLGEQHGVSRCPALLALGRLRARRGDPEAGATLDEAWRVALSTRELQRIGPAGAARAEHAWLEGDLEAAAAASRRWPPSTPWARCGPRRACAGVCAPPACAASRGARGPPRARRPAG